MGKWKNLLFCIIKEGFAFEATDCDEGSTQNVAQRCIVQNRKRVNHSSAQRNVMVNAPLEPFLLGMTSSVESFNSRRYTPIYENEQKEGKIICWRLLTISEYPREFDH